MQTSPRARWLALLALVALVAPVPATAHHHVFSSSVDRFEVDGNVFGSADGALDFVDEFDDGVLAPEWSPLLGTAVETGGVAVLENPGTDISIGSLTLDVSNIELEDDVEDGGGNFTMSSYWMPVVPQTDAEFHLQLYGVGSLIEAAGLSFTNQSAASAAAVPGSLAGPAIAEQLTRIGGDNTITRFEVPVDAGAITGRIVLRLSFDDDTNLLTGSFSLDGGVTFQSPFPPIPIFNGVTASEVLLGAGGSGPPTAPPPPPAPQTVAMKLLHVKNPSLPTARQVIYKVKDTGHTVVGNPMIAGATLKVMVDGTTQCFTMPARGWSAINGMGFKYADTHGVDGPVKVAQIKRARSGIFQTSVTILGKLGAIDLVPPNPGVRGDTNLHLRGGADYCGSTAGGTVLANNAKSFKVNDAPAPAGCGVTACSPSGAFIDDKAILGPTPE
jgi:hypothetical protein